MNDQMVSDLASFRGTEPLLALAAGEATRTWAFVLATVVDMKAEFGLVCFSCLSFLIEGSKAERIGVLRVFCYLCGNR
jgi:hypothetical protein